MLVYLAIINIVAFIMFGIDKFKAKHSMWRTPERVLMLAAFVGGSIGALSGMLLFRHKTRHKLFIIGVPMILLLQLLLIIWVTFGEINPALLLEI